MKIRMRRSDRGATLIIVSLLLTTLLVIVALVIDLSFVRNTRQESKSTTDAAAAAGVQSLATDDDVVARPWRGACASLAYMRLNESDRSFDVSYMDGAGNEIVDASGVPIGSLVCSDAAYLTRTCTDTIASTWAWIRAVDGDHVVDIRAGYRTPDPAFPEDLQAYATDDGRPCNQLAVIASSSDDAYFGGVAGAARYDTAIRSVGRITIGTVGDGVPAFLMLERRSCDVLYQHVGSGDGIIVNAIGDDPGIIHIDSSGTDPSCGGNSAGNFTVFSGTLGTGLNKHEGIRVYGVTAGSPGILSLRSHQFQSDRTESNYHGYSSAEGVFATPRDGGVVSRKRVDEKYNPAPEPSVTPAVKTVAYRHRNDLALLSQTTGFDTTIEGDDCTGHSDIDVAGFSVLVKCPSGYSPSTVVLPDARTVVFTGPVAVDNGNSLFMPAAERIVVGGSTSGGVFVTGTGRFGVNAPVFSTDISTPTTPPATTPPPVDLACTNREGPAASRTTTLTIFGGALTGDTPGALNLGGYSALCQTSVYLAGPRTAAQHTPQWSLDTSYDETCIDRTPCPANGALPGANMIIGGYVKWSAPNQLTAQPTKGHAGVEDLALWSESSTTVRFGNSGILDSKGVFFLPNARAEVRAPTRLTPVDAQFISRSLELLHGTLNMQPDPANSTFFDVLESVQLVR